MRHSSTNYCYVTLYHLPINQYYRRFISMCCLVAAKRDVKVWRQIHCWHSNFFFTKRIPHREGILQKRLRLLSVKVCLIVAMTIEMMGGISKTITTSTMNKSLNLLLYHRRIRLSSIEEVYIQIIQT